MALALGAHAGTGVLPPHPNVVFILPDDLSYNDYSMFNPKGPHTPRVDSLAQTSERLTDFHVSPTCSPSRACIMTGRYNDDAAVWHTIMGRYFLWTNEVTMADVFKANGYDTALFGKWHLGDSYPFRPEDRGFSHVVMIHGGGIDQQPDFWGNRNTPPATLYIENRPISLDESNGAFPSSNGVFATNFFTSQAIAYMQHEIAAHKPFFAYIPFNVAHDPQDMPPDARPGISAHTATVENMDKNIGRILDFLKQSGEEDNTVVMMVLGDNGMANSRYRGGKGSEYEAGHRVPCLIRWPAAGFGGQDSESKEVAALTANIDLLPTLMDLLHLHDVTDRSASVPIQGCSLAPLLNSSSPQKNPELQARIIVVDNQREDLLIKYKQACIMKDEIDANGVVVHEWRLIVPSETAPLELYDAKADPHEVLNLATKVKNASLVTALKAAYETWWAGASEHALDYGRQVLGTSIQPEVCLYSHDWHMQGGPPWNQEMIANGQTGNGFNPVTISRPGVYSFDLRRWPREIGNETTLTSTLKSPLRIGSAGADGMEKTTVGRALPIYSARLRIWNGDQTYSDTTRNVDPSSPNIVFRVKSLPAGPAMVQTWFIDASGKPICGAYYDYVSRVAAQ